MKKIRTEMRRSNGMIGVCILLFICFNLYITGDFVNRYTDFLAEYRTANAVTSSYNNSKTYFYLYIKQHETDIQVNFQEADTRTIQLLEDMKEKMQGDRNCRMMYRIVVQMLENRKEKLEAYVNNPQEKGNVDITYINNMELQIERNMNLLTGYYMEFITIQCSAYAKQLRTLALLANAILVFSAGTLLLINTKICRNILFSIDKLTDAAKEIGEQNFESKDIEHTQYVEMNFVIQTFNEMKHSIRNMIMEINKNFEIKERLSEQVLENEKKERRLAESKMKELQMQINPHFLFNTLSLVMRSIQLDEKETSVILIKSISKILRSSIETKSMEIPLDQEIELLESYLFIQRVHCKGRISFQLDIRKSYSDEETMVPPLLIQPIVENAVKHGLKNITGGGEVKILITEKPKWIQVCVQDNGCGISQEVLEQIWKHVPTKNIGLGNVLERLQLLYHRDDVMKIESSENGTSITMYLYKEQE